jgi:hypothetical protein
MYSVPQPDKWRRQRPQVQLSLHSNRGICSAGLLNRGFAEMFLTPGPKTTHGKAGD